jgi:putative membrane protein insertion efficiency factor
VFISPWLGSRCRYVPTCSEYAKQALEEFGIVEGSRLSLRRISRCHPWGDDGYDPLPNKKPVDKSTNKKQSPEQ